MIPDPSRYLRHLEGWSLSDAQKAELIAALRTLLEGFVDRAFGQHPAQQVAASRSKSDAGEGRNLIEYKSTSTNHFNESAGQEAGRKDCHEGE